MTKKKTKTPKPKDAPLTEAEYDEMASEEGFRLEQESYFEHFNQFSKEELIHMLIDFQESEQQLCAWLMSEKGGLTAYGGGLSAIKDKLDGLRRERDFNAKKRKEGRQKQAFKKVAETEKATALGVEDFYGLLCEAITILEINPKLREDHPTEVKAIREIVVNLLFESNRSSHTYDRSQWVKTVALNIKSNHIFKAKKSLKNKRQT